MFLKDFKKRYRADFKSKEDFTEEKLEPYMPYLGYMLKGFKPLPFQIPAILAVSRFRDILYCDEPGMGKTPTTIASMSDMYKNGHRKFLVVVLASILGQWSDSFKKFSSFSFEMIKGGREQRALQYRRYVSENKDVLLISYNTLATDDVTIRNIFNFDTMICDECDYFKSPRSQIFKVIQTYSRYIKSIKLLTGTPFNGKLEDTFAILNVVSHCRYSLFWLKNTFCKTAKADIAVYDKHTNAKRTIKHELITGYQNIDKFRDLIGGYIFGRKAVDVGATLPIVHDNFIYLDEPAKLKKYQDLILSGWFIDSDKIKHKLNSLQKISYLHRGSHSLKTIYPKIDYVNPKKDKIIEIINAHPDEQFAIFCNYKQLIDELYPLLEDKGGCSRVEGGIVGTSRLNSLDKFKRGDNQFLLLSMAGYAGLDLNNCKNLIITDFIYNRAKFGQIQGRIQRTNSKFKDVDIYYLAYKDSIDTAIINLLESRGKQINYLETEEQVSTKILSEISNHNGIKL